MQYSCRPVILALKERVLKDAQRVRVFYRYKNTGSLRVVHLNRNDGVCNREIVLLKDTTRNGHQHALVGLGWVERCLDLHRSLSKY